MTFHDPVKNFTELMISEGVVDEEGVEDIQKRIEKEFDEGFVFTDDGYWSRDPSREGGTT